ncbi:hypothetical protein [uncultured Sunxiuqinia sp.]|uniref:hypothetical protein n=1 Tax=uncultured Sunxiuqinia sp. TaxID=1573825 RepID=UPI002AA7B901|nr:hypothetical protein [uncultured Sunxiuqinia sp.]
MSDRARKYIVELFKIVGTDSILVIQSNGHLLRLHCPFKVVCRVNVPPLTIGETYNVMAVKMTLKREEVFIIDDRAYFVWFFTIKA